MQTIPFMAFTAGMGKSEGQAGPANAVREKSSSGDSVQKSKFMQALGKAAHEIDKRIDQAERRTAAPSPVRLGLGARTPGAVSVGTSRVSEQESAAATDNPDQEVKLPEAFCEAVKSLVERLNANVSVDEQITPQELQDILTNPSDLMQMLSALMQLLGTGIDQDSQAAGQNLPAGSEGDQTALSLLSTVSGPEEGLSQTASPLTGMFADSMTQSGPDALNQVIKVLEQAIHRLAIVGQSPELASIRALIKGQHDETSQMPPAEFLNKLVENLTKLVEGSSQVSGSQVQSRTISGQAVGQVVDQAVTQAVAQTGLQASASGAETGIAPQPQAVKGNNVETVPAGYTEQSAAAQTPASEGQTQFAGHEDQALTNPQGKEAQVSEEHSTDARNIKPSQVSEEFEAVRIEKHVTAQARTGKGIDSEMAQAAAAQGDAKVDMTQLMTHNAKLAEQAGQAPKMAEAIFGQIAQKAKLVVAPGFSEMQIQLKPEFLGKLNLVISSENGVVTAKFSTEHYRVKEVIEANMDALKSALADQGVKVDQLLVSVSSQKDYSGFRGQEGTAFGQNGGGRGHRNSYDEAEQNRIISAVDDSGSYIDYPGASLNVTA